MNNIRVLDVTLRDGGCVNNFDFGNHNIEAILAALEASNVDYIELGYIDEKNGSITGRTQYANERVIAENIIKRKKSGVTYVAMMDYGKFNVDNLRPRTETDIDGIRMAFHKKNMLDIIPVGRKIIEKGYKFFVQPMITLRYSDAELLTLIDLVNKELPDASGFYIVDSFGEMRPNDMSRVLNLVDHNLIPSMTLGFHSHNNLQMSYSNAISMLQFPTNRDLMLDCSIMGMGKGAGNLNTELLLEHLNLYYGKQYRIAPLLEVIDKVINQIHSELYWGYAPEYYLSATNQCTPSYAGHFYNKHMLPIDQVGELLAQIAPEKKISFDKQYADQLYYSYVSNHYEDEKTIDELRSILENGEVLLLAPGKSIVEYKDVILSLIDTKKLTSISVNNTSLIDADYTFVSKESVINAIDAEGTKMIVCSNVSTNPKYLVVNNSKWSLWDQGQSDNSTIILINILLSVGVTKIYLAGFDGFSTSIQENYYDHSLMRPVTLEQAESRNELLKRYFASINDKVSIEFVTPSKYQG